MEMGGQLNAPAAFLSGKTLREHNSKEVSKSVSACWQKENVFPSWGWNPSCSGHGQLISSSFRCTYLKLYSTMVRKMVKYSSDTRE
jgi:hypothetical protein